MTKQANTTVKLNNVRTSFFNGFEATSFSPEQEKKFSSHFLLGRDHPQFGALQKALKDVAVAKWGEKGEATLKALIAQEKVCLRDGNKKLNSDDEVAEGYADMVYVPATSKKRPTIVDRDRSPLTEQDGKPYSGCYVNAILNIWAQDNQFGKRINAQWMGAQFVADGESFGGGGATASPDDFDSLADEFGGDDALAGEDGLI